MHKLIYCAVTGKCIGYTKLDGSNVWFSWDCGKRSIAK